MRECLFARHFAESDCFEESLKGSQYDNPEILKEVIDDGFENSTKRQFKDAGKVSWLRVGNRDENNTKLGIRQGRLRMDG